jgi:Ca-activated chloride channel homolog
MRYQFKAFCLALSIILLLCQGSLSQQARQTPDEQVLVRIDTDLVAVDVTVTDHQGNYMLDLKPEDFELLEDGAPRSIEFFQPVRTLQQSPLALVVALDLSGSLSPEEIALQRDSIEQFIKMMDSTSVCALIGFNYKVDVLQDFTSDHKKLAQTLRKIKDYGGSTRIYDGLDRAVTMLKKAPAMRSGKRLRRVIVVVTDGFDSASVIDKKELVRRANLNGITIYSVTIPSYSPMLSKGTGQDRLPTLLDVTRIIDNTGGRDFPVQNKDFSLVFDAIARELAAGYTLAYHPPKESLASGLHRLQVRVKRPGVLTRVSRDSYIAETK